MNGTTYTAADLAELVQGELVGDDCTIHGISTLGQAVSTQISFLANSRYTRELETTKAGVVLIKSEHLAKASGAAIVVNDPYLAYAKVSQLFASKGPAAGISPAASVHPSALVPTSCYIAPGAVIETGVRLGENVVVGSNCVIESGAVVGNNTRLSANVSIGAGVTLGARCIIHSGAVIGADGFGFAPSSAGWVKIAQLGSVCIGDDVEIGACTTIDRGALSDTWIGDGVKLDNQIQIAHNVTIGDHTAIAGGCAIAGSTRIGKRCTIAGMSGITGHLEIADGTHITAMSLVTKSIREAGAYSSGTAIEPHQQWKRNAVRFRQLDEMHKRISELEELVKELCAKG